MRFPLPLVLCAIAAAQSPRPAKPRQPVAVERLVQSVTSDALRGHVSFLASDLLEGRETPSRGLDIAAEYIASQFRAAGLEPTGDQGFFQTAELDVVRAGTEGFAMSVAHPAGTVEVDASHVSLGSEIYEAFEIKDAPVVKVLFGQMPETDLQGKVVVTRFPPAAGASNLEISERYAAMASFLNAMRTSGAALVINVDPGRRARERNPPAFTDAESRRQAVRVVTVNHAELAKLFEELPAGPAPWTVSARVAAPESRKVVSRNVAALLRGSDPKLRETYVLVSAHYDHVGTRPSGPDRIFNGANDNAGGVAAVIELAHALASLRPAPKRSILFIAFFGEEIGLVGSRYYASHPLVPLDRTVAQINLEHVGRTDDVEGSQKGRATVTGFEYSDIGPILRKAAAALGYDIYNRPGNATYFERSDNVPLAQAGIPAHTLVVSVEYPDYHQPDDEWEKLDYANMERLVEAVSAGVLAIANSAAPPQWNAASPGAKPYRKARD